MLMMNIMLNNTFYRFIYVGIINTIIGCLIMFILYNIFKLSYYFSSMVNYISVSILSFFLNKYFTFKNKKRSISQFISFMLNIFTCYILAYSLSRCAIYSLLQNMDDMVCGNLSLVMGMILFSIFNYLGQKIIVFRSISK